VFGTDGADVRQRAFTGDLPPTSRIDRVLAEVHARYRGLDDGEVADYIPVLAEADPSWFALSLIDASGGAHEVGDVDIAFSIQSISKAFVFALVCEARSHEFVHERIGVNNTGLPFNSVMAIELNHGKPMNSMVNAGAIATTALMRGDTPAEKWESIRTGLSRFAGRHLELDGQVYRSEIETNQRNRPSRGCWRATGGSSPTPWTPSTSTRGSAPCPSPPMTSPSWERHWPTAG